MKTIYQIVAYKAGTDEISHYAGDTFDTLADAKSFYNGIIPNSKLDYRIEAVQLMDKANGTDATAERH